MIGLHLPRGTKIECVRPSVTAKYHDADPLTAGQVYTLRGYYEAPSGVGIYLEEVEGPLNTRTGKEIGYGRHLFNVVQLPKLPAVLLECLNARPVDKREVVEG